MQVRKREIFGWAMYDFANSAFATTILAVIFNRYFASVVAGGEKGVIVFGLHLHGASFFTFTISLSMALYHLGIAEKVVVAAFSIIFGGIVLSLALAFGWGGRELAKDFLEKLYRRKEQKKEEQDPISHI